MIAGPDNFCFGLACFLVLFLDNLSEVLDNVAEAMLCQNILPKVGGLQAARIDRVSLATIIAFVER